MMRWKEDFSCSFYLPLSLCSFLLFPTLGVGLLDLKRNSSPRPELFSSPGSAQPAKCFWSAQPRPGAPNPSVPGESPWSAQPHCVWSAQPQSVPGVPNPRVSLRREGLDVKSKIIFFLAMWAAQDHVRSRTHRLYRVCLVKSERMSNA